MCVVCVCSFYFSSPLFLLLWFSWFGETSDAVCTGTSLTADCNSSVPTEAFAETFASHAAVDCAAASTGAAVSVAMAAAVVVLLTMTLLFVAV